ncbi:MAG TPA: acyltransferase domain-containing protein, partial [Propionibacteriaceae bacterium]|nr:acyltransferase domain-containing protein [Propionibacteriaceae bacterium]
MDRLRRDDWPERLALLGFWPEDRAPAQAMIEGVLDDADDLARVEVLADRLRARLGDYFNPWEGDLFEPSDDTHRLGRGVLPMCALLATADDVHEHHLSRGIDPDISWASLADLGQQVYKDHRVNGSTGLHNHTWLRGDWAGGHAWLGRLQYELTRSDLGRGEGDEYVLSVHIPETGPL